MRNPLVTHVHHLSEPLLGSQPRHRLAVETVVVTFGWFNGELQPLTHHPGRIVTLRMRPLSLLERDVPRDGTLLGALFESLVALSVRTYAQTVEASRVSHLRTRAGEHEIDLIVERGDRGVVAFEVKLNRNDDDSDCRHLLWLRDQIGDDLLDAAVITTGGEAYRRPDGIGVIPADLLGP